MTKSAALKGVIEEREYPWSYKDLLGSEREYSLSRFLIEVSHPPGLQAEGVTAGADRGSEEREKQQC